jgi:hypothetical protein
MFLRVFNHLRGKTLVSVCVFLTVFGWIDVSLMSITPTRAGLGFLESGWDHDRIQNAGERKAEGIDFAFAA